MTLAHATAAELRAMLDADLLTREDVIAILTARAIRDVGLGQLRHPATASTRYPFGVPARSTAVARCWVLAALSHAVLDVVGVRPKPEVRRVHTRWVVAVVKNKQTIRDGAVSQLP